MATASAPRCTQPCPLCSESACRSAALADMDPEAIPDEIDLLLVMWARVRGGCGERLPV